MAFKLFEKSAKPLEEKTHQPISMVDMAGLAQAIWSSKSTTSLTRNGYLHNPIGFRSVKLILEAAGSVPWVLQDHERRFHTHQLLQLLKRPNAYQARSAFLETVFGQYLLSGNVFIETVRDEEGAAQELYVLRSERVKILADGKGWPQAYEYQVGSKRVRLGYEDVLHIKSFHPQDDHYGHSPMVAAAHAIDVHNASNDWAKALLDNAARPSGALVYKAADGPAHMSEQQYQRLSREIEDNHQGARNAGRPMLLEGGLDWKPMGFSPADMEFHRTKDAAARDIALALGVPPMLLGIPGDNSYANYQEANRAFFRLTILPLVTHICAELSYWLCAEDGLEFQADFDKIPALASEREADWRRIISADFLSEAEKRQLLGFPREKGE